MDIKRFPEKMGDLPIDFSNPKRTLISGLFQETAKVGGQPRKFLTYIPEGLDYCQPCLVAAIPSGEKPEEYLETSGLKAFAEDKKLFLHLATSETAWNADGRDADYLNAIYVAIQARDFYITMQDNIYLCGIGDGSFAAHQAARRMASEWSGLMTFGDLNGDLNAEHTALRGESDQGEVELKVMGMAAQLPVWMSMTAKTADNTAAVDFWKEQNHVVGAPLSGEGADEIWMPTPVRVLSEVNEEQIAQVRLAVREDPFTKEQMEAAWSYIGLARRHRGPGKKQLRYFKEPIACGAEKKTMEVDGMTRTWYEYVPKSCTPDQKWPLVVVFHGRGGTAETFFDLSCVSTVAEERHFIAVVPEAGVYQHKLMNGAAADEQFLAQVSAVVILFCCGGTGWYGALNEGLTGDGSILITKSILDFVTACIFGSILGKIVPMLCIPQAIIYGALFLGSGAVQSFITPDIIADFSATGGIITLCAGLSLAGIKKDMKVLNLLPSLILIFLISSAWTALMG